MNAEEKQKLQQMIEQNNTQDNTPLIRTLKHSAQIRKSVSIIQNIKRQSSSQSFQELDKEAQARGCGFLFIHYPNIYNKLLKNEIQIKVLYTFLDELEKIEKGDQDQHEASYKIGTLLKEMFVDKKLDIEKEEKKTKHQVKRKNITYEEFKIQQNGANK